ncbi:MAG: rhamnogalacturonan acetylesterase [Verrucomicrobiota bacterium]
MNFSLKWTYLLLVFLCCFLLELRSENEMNGGTENSKVSIFLVGDSTVASYKPQVAPLTGWGQVFGEFFKENVQVQNHAVSGCSTKSFRDLGLWKKAIQATHAQDYLFIQFSHNDEKKDHPDVYAEAHTDFKENLKRFIAEARERNVNPILVTPVCRRNFSPQGKLVETHGEYPQVIRETATEEGVPLIDLTAKSFEYFQKQGPEGTLKIFLWLDPGVSPNYPKGSQDNTHFSETGARAIAQLVVDNLKAIDHPLAQSLK